MDDFNVANLSEAKNEYSIRLVNLLTPVIMQGIKSIFVEAKKLCVENNEESKYLMTFQNFLARVPKWNSSIIESETQRIIKESKCSYIEDLITCVHIAQLKILTSIRVGQKQKKIDIDIPRLDSFIHRIYIAVARKIFSNVYLFEEMIPPLNYQKNMRECDTIIKECVLDTIRESMPIEHILRSYMGPTVEEDVEEEIIETKEIDTSDASENVVDNESANVIENDNNTQHQDIIDDSQDNQPQESQPENTNKTVQLNGTQEQPGLQVEIIDKPIPENNQEEIQKQQIEPLQSIRFKDMDAVLDMGSNTESNINAPKDIQTLEHISEMRNIERKQQELDDDEDDDMDRITIHTDTDINLGDMDVHHVDNSIKVNEAPLLTDIEVLT